MSNDSSRWLQPGDPEAISASLVTQFADVFGRHPHGVWFAPGRANLNGEHIDFHGGRCLPMALRHGTYAAAAPRNDGVLRLRTLDSALDTGIVEIPAERSQQFPRPEHDSGIEWTRYVWGVLWALRRLESTAPELTVGPDFGADVLICSTLPIGAGLSSSASLECAVAMAFVALGAPFGVHHPGPNLNSALADGQRATLAQACIRAEVEVVGAGTGGLDQTTSLRAVNERLASLDCRDFSVSHMHVSPLLDDYRLVAVDTGHPHTLVTSEFTDRRAESESAAAVLGVARLRDALPERPTIADVDGLLARYDAAATTATLGGADPSACRLRLSHALNEMLRSESVHNLLAAPSGGPDAVARKLGEAMTEGHASMRDDAQVSFPAADEAVDTVLAAGALGARLIGGGFGGSVLVLLHHENLDRVTTAAADLSPDVKFLEVTPSPSAHAVPLPHEALNLPANASA